MLHVEKNAHVFFPYSSCTSGQVVLAETACANGVQGTMLFWLLFVFSLGVGILYFSWVVVDFSNVHCQTKVKCQKLRENCNFDPSRKNAPKQCHSASFCPCRMARNNCFGQAALALHSAKIPFQQLLFLEVVGSQWQFESFPSGACHGPLRRQRNQVQILRIRCGQCSFWNEVIHDLTQIQTSASSRCVHVRQWILVSLAEVQVLHDLAESAVSDPKTNAKGRVTWFFTTTGIHTDRKSVV